MRGLGDGKEYMEMGLVVLQGREVVSWDTGMGWTVGVLERWAVDVRQERVDMKQLRCADCYVQVRCIIGELCYTLPVSGAVDIVFLKKGYKLGATHVIYRGMRPSRLLQIWGVHPRQKHWGTDANVGFIVFQDLNASAQNRLYVRRGVTSTRRETVVGRVCVRAIDGRRRVWEAVMDGTQVVWGFAYCTVLGMGGGNGLVYVADCRKRFDVEIVFLHGMKASNGCWGGCHEGRGWRPSYKSNVIENNEKLDR